MRSPIPLQPGDTIVIASSARKISEAEIRFAVYVLEQRGYKIIYTPNLFLEDNQFAGTVSERVEGLQWAINHREAKAILFARGGYGTAQIIDFINFAPLNIYPKWIVGFSDITVILSHLQKYNYPCVHGIMPIVFDKQGAESSINQLMNILEGKPNLIKVKYHSFNKVGKVRAPVIGGNLSLLSNNIGTPSDINTDNSILFLEDVDEYLYHIDRMMNHLDRSGKLKKLAGLVVGHFSDMKDNTVPFGKDAYQIIKDYTSSYNYPVCYGFPVGHQSENMPIICNHIATLEITLHETTFFQEPL
jgi:muramoyltetrapeptide carboxypeptidase